MTFEWRHPNYYKELSKLKEEAERELQEEDKDNQEKEED